MRALVLFLAPVALLLTGYHPAFAQCKTAPPLDSCFATPAPVNNEIMAAGTKKYYSGAATTFTNLTLRGATLVVCSQLTITNLVVDSGTIIIRPGAKLTAGGGGSGMVWKGGCTLYNYGTFEITSNLSLEGPDASAARPNIVMNVTPASIISDDFNYFVINNAWSWFVNNGKASFMGVITDNGASAGCVCLGPASELKERTLINKVKDAYTVPSYHACVNVTSFSQFTDTLTNDPGLLTCVPTAHTSATGGTNKPNAWGAATLFQHCTACAGLALLPVSGKAVPAKVVDQDAAGTVVSPNPFINTFRITWQTGNPAQSVIVLGNSGQVVYQQRLTTEATGNHVVISTSDWPYGPYYLQIIYRHGSASYKMMKITK